MSNKKNYKKLVNKNYSFRLEPNELEKSLIAQYLGCARLVHNYFLDKSIKEYKENGTSYSAFSAGVELTVLKKEEEYKFLNDPHRTILMNTLRDLERSYKMFFKHYKSGWGFPRFKSKKNSKNSFRIANGNLTNSTGGDIRIEGNRVRLPKIGMVKFRQSKEVRGTILSVTITHTRTGKYFVILNCKDVPISDKPDNYKGAIPDGMDIDVFTKRVILESSGLSPTSQKSVIGIDMGLKDFIITSIGNKISNPKFYVRDQKKLARAQRALSRKTRGSANYEKVRVKVARIHERIANRRGDFLNKLSTYIVMTYDIICVETLAIKNMVKNKKLSKHIGDSSWGEFIRQLEYKAEWYGKTLVKIDRFFASSQLCSECGHKNTDVKDLKVRKWECQCCGSVHDRDHNAAINICNEGMRILSTTMSNSTSTVTDTGI